MWALNSNTRGRVERVEKASFRTDVVGICNVAKQASNEKDATAGAHYVCIVVGKAEAVLLSGNRAGGGRKVDLAHGGVQRDAGTLMQKL